MHVAPPSARFLLWRLPRAAVRSLLVAIIVLMWVVLPVAVWLQHAEITGVSLGGLVLARLFFPGVTRTATCGLIAAYCILVRVAIWAGLLVAALAVIAAGWRGSMDDIGTVLVECFVGFFVILIAYIMMWIMAVFAGVPLEPEMPGPSHHTLPSAYDEPVTTYANRRRR